MTKSTRRAIIPSIPLNSSHPEQTRSASLPDLSRIQNRPPLGLDSLSDPLYFSVFLLAVGLQQPPLPNIPSYGAQALCDFNYMGCRRLDQGSYARTRLGHAEGLWRRYDYACYMHEYGAGHGRRCVEGPFRPPPYLLTIVLTQSRLNYLADRLRKG